MLEFIKQNKIILIVIAIIILGIGAILFFRKEAENKLIETETSNSKLNAIDGQTNLEDSSGEELNAQDEANIEDAQDIPITEDDSPDISGILNPDENVYANITAEHCRRDCEAYSNQAKYFEYCRQVCAIAPEKDVSNCDGKSGLEKDYCLKDLGIKKLDKSICEQIEDANIKKTCKNRIAQEQIESQVHEPVD